VKPEESRDFEIRKVKPIARRKITVRRKQRTAKTPQYSESLAVQFQNRKMRTRFWIAIPKNN
jgi:hypothetical protein